MISEAEIFCSFYSFKQIDGYVFWNLGIPNYTYLSFNHTILLLLLYIFFLTVWLLYLFYVDFHCKFIVRSVSSACTLLVEWRTPLETWLWHDNKHSLIAAHSISIIFLIILGWKHGGLAWKCYTFVKSLKTTSVAELQPRRLLPWTVP